VSRLPATVTVRKATIHDLDALAPLFDAYRQFYKKPSDLSTATRFIAERIRHSESTILVAVEDGVVLGFVQLYPTFSSVSAGRIYILNDLFVADEARKRGVARLLLRAAAEFAKAAGAVRMTLQTELSNAAARALYEAEGWTLQTEYANYDLELR
jgi:ribosomal protein S18 acetylase RimI-like enzyme